MIKQSPRLPLWMWMWMCTFTVSEREELQRSVKLLNSRRGWVKGSTVASSHPSSKHTHVMHICQASSHPDQLLDSSLPCIWPTNQLLHWIIRDPDCPHSIHSQYGANQYNAMQLERKPKWGRLVSLQNMACIYSPKEDTSIIIQLILVLITCPSLALQIISHYPTHLHKQE